MNERCCPACSGATPYKICRHPLALGWLNNPIGCPCHIAASNLAAKTPNRLGHRDPTADTAIGNLTNNRRKRP